MKPVFSVQQHQRDVWAVVRYFDGHKNCVHMTGCRLEAERMRAELERADRRAFYEGLIIGRSEGERMIAAATAVDSIAIIRAREAGC